MFSCAGMARRAPARSISVARVARDSRETTSHDSNVESPAAVALPIPPPIPIASQSSRAVGRTRGRSDTRPDPTSTARARASPFLHTRTMSALLASSFVGRVAAFKATKVQVRTVFFFVDRRWSSSLARRVARDDANGRARAREIRSARAVVVRWTTRDDAIGARAR